MRRNIHNPASFVLLSVLVVLSFTVAACGGKNPIKAIGPNVSEVRINTDSSAVQPEIADTFPTEAELLEQQSVPQAVDEVFNDFINNFDMKDAFQRQRVAFPLTVSEANGQTTTINADEWQHRYLFMRQDYCTVLWNSEQEMYDFDGMDEPSEASVEQFYLHSGTMTTLSFQRDELGRWMLLEIHNGSFQNHELASFIDFYRQFVTDTIYQHQHLMPHLKYATADDESEDGIIEGTIDSEQWRQFAPEMPQDAITNIRYGQTYNHPHRIVMQMYGFADGFQSLFHFRRDGSEWKLTGFEN